MTPDEIRIVEALAACSFLPGSSQKRFVRQMSGRDRQKPLTDRQGAYLWAIAWSWRRQLSRGLVDLAREKSGGVGIRRDWLGRPSAALPIAQARHNVVDAPVLSERCLAQLELF